MLTRRRISLTEFQITWLNVHMAHFYQNQVKNVPKTPKNIQKRLKTSQISENAQTLKISDFLLATSRRGCGAAAAAAAAAEKKMSQVFGTYIKDINFSDRQPFNLTNT